MGDTPDAAQKVAAGAQAVATAASVAEETVTAPPKVKIRKHRQRSCDEKDAKGKLCAGHLKRWYDFPRRSSSWSVTRRRSTAANSVRRSIGPTPSNCRIVLRFDTRPLGMASAASPRGVPPWPFRHRNSRRASGLKTARHGYANPDANLEMEDNLIYDWNKVGPPSFDPRRKADARR